MPSMGAPHAPRAEIVPTRDRIPIGVSSTPTTTVSFARVALDDLLGRRRTPADPEAHLLAAEAWLCRAHDMGGNGGVSWGYSLRGGWRPSYPETSGYIATTFLRLARDRHPSYRQRALHILD